jgi:hypothetical protein
VRQRDPKRPLEAKVLRSPIASTTVLQHLNLLDLLRQRRKVSRQLRLGLDHSGSDLLPFDVIGRDEVAMTVGGVAVESGGDMSVGDVVDGDEEPL